MKRRKKSRGLAGSASQHEDALERDLMLAKSELDAAENNRPRACGRAMFALEKLGAAAAENLYVDQPFRGGTITQLIKRTERVIPRVCGCTSKKEKRA